MYRKTRFRQEKVNISQRYYIASFAFTASVVEVKICF